MKHVPLFEREAMTSPFIGSLNLDNSDEATLELAMRSHELVKLIGLDGLQKSVHDRRYHHPSQGNRHAPRPTHDKFLLAGEESPNCSPVGSRIWGHKYRANPDTKILEVSQIKGNGERRLAYVKEPHNHVQGRVSIVQEGKFSIAEWRLRPGSSISQADEESSIDYWTDLAETLVFTGIREYQPGDVMAIYSREVHCIVEVEPGTTTLALEGPKGRDYSVPFSAVAGRLIADRLLYV
jgi:hypothetical protein